MVACSGGPDSLALAAATAFVAPRLGLRAGLVTVDHGLQAGSAERAADVVAWAKDADLSPAFTVEVDATPHGDGPEAAARSARYAALADAARREHAPVVLLGHTREDQAETVLLALARGAGVRGLSGMPVRRDADGVAFLRPLLDVARADTADACVELGLVPWTDPHNDDARFARSRVRSALPLLSELLGPGVVANLARTARLAAADTAALDGWAAAAEATARDDDGSLDIATIAAMPSRDPDSGAAQVRAAARCAGRRPRRHAHRRPRRAGDGVARPRTCRVARRDPRWTGKRVACALRTVMMHRHLAMRTPRVLPPYRKWQQDYRRTVMWNNRKRLSRCSKVDNDLCQCGQCQIPSGRP